ncbi:MAG: hypothetical protein VYD57_04400 [Pseudomonadota bacterium]|nr:hypothetical protein [Pseudomonadota bacterium]
MTKIARPRLHFAAIALLFLSNQPVESLARTGPYCPHGRAVVTGTVQGQAQLDRLLGDQARPELVQAAALLAAVVPEQKDVARQILLAELQARGLPAGWRGIFDMLLNEAEAGQYAAGYQREIAGQVIGGIVGGLAGKLATDSNILGFGGAIGGGQAGQAFVRKTAGIYIEIIVGKLADAARRMIRNPCNVSAAEALEEIRKR